MKKLKIILGVFALSLCFNLMSNTDIVLAQAVADTISITTDTTINEDITLSVSDADGYVIESGATLTLREVTISSSGSEDVNNIFYVKSGGKLILDDVKFLSATADCAIMNEGEVEIINATISTSITTSVYNNSGADSLQLHTGTIPKITIEQGYISVFEDTTLSSTSRITMSDAFDGKLVVKGSGTNVFANKLIDKFTLTNSDYVLDYIGDGCTATNDDEFQLSAGDIVCTKYDTLTATSGSSQLNYAGNYCTASNFLQSYVSEGEYPVYKCVRKIVYMNNYTCCTSDNRYIWQANGNAVELTVKCYIAGEASAFSTEEYSYPTGSNWAIFIDIPSGYEVESMTLDNSSLELGSEYSNNYYMRPIIEYNSTIYDEYINATLQVTFSAIPTTATLSITKEDNVELEYDSELTIGNEHTFTIKKSEDYRVLGVKFNDIDVVLTDKDDSYIFTATLFDSNTLVITSLDLPYEITVIPNSFDFIYGEEVILTQEYLVEVTGETIVITFTPSANTNVGSYEITEGVASSDDYSVNIADGEYYYTISPKSVSVDEIIIEPYETTYFEGIADNITNELFIVSIPSYFKATMLFDDDLTVYQTIEFRIDLVDTNNYVFADPTKTIISTMLTIKPQEVDTTGYKLIDLTGTYDGTAKTPNVDNIDSNLLTSSYTYYMVGEDNSMTEVASMIGSGKYFVEARFVSKSDFYATSLVLEDYFIINKATIELDNYVALIGITTVTYDGCKHYIDDMRDSLPSEVNDMSVDDNIGYIYADTYYINIKIVYDSDNYICLDTVVATLIIEPKEINVSLINSSFVYTGEIPILTATTEGVLDGENVNVTLGDIVTTDVGEYSVAISLDNSNYYTDTTILTYEITKAMVDLTDITYNNIEATYDGERHLPVLSGTLPLGITYTIDNNAPCIDVGIYNVKCSFSNANKNYETPSDIYATVTIKPKSIFVEFNQPEDVIANGEKKTLGISFLDVIEGDEIDYSVSYSGDCILAGEYTCTVTLAYPSNYKIVNSRTYDFIIFNGTTSYVSDDINLTLEGKFKAGQDVNVLNTTSNLNIVNAVADKDFTSYSSYKVSYQNYSNEPVSISIESTGLFSSKNLTIYRVVDGRLEEIEYTISDGLITFEIQGTEELLFVDNSSDNAILIGLIIGATIVLLLGSILGIIFRIRYVRKKKASHNTHYND